MANIVFHVKVFISLTSPPPFMLPSPPSLPLGVSPTAIIFYQLPAFTLVLFNYITLGASLRAGLLFWINLLPSKNLQPTSI